MRWRIGILAAYGLMTGCGLLQEATPSYQAKFAKGQLDDEFSEFVDKHEGQTVKLDLQWAPGAFQGGAESDFAFFVLFESCAEPLEKGELPNVGNCNGTEYNVPKVEGKPGLAETGGASSGRASAARSAPRNVARRCPSANVLKCKLNRLVTHQPASKATASR